MSTEITERHHPHHPHNAPERVELGRPNLADPTYHHELLAAELRLCERGIWTIERGSRPTLTHPSSEPVSSTALSRSQRERQEKCR